MHIADWLATATTQLKEAGIESARLDALLLLEDTTGLDRSMILAHPEQKLTDEKTNILTTQLKRRLTHEPMAYIRGKAEFYGREFTVNEHVLVPRPETEMIIELLLKLPEIANAQIIDVGTGSGALAVTAKLELPDAHVTAVDIDEHCVALARQNAVNLQADITVGLSDLLNNIVVQKNDKFTPVILLCNLPYVPEEYAVNKAATHEPDVALFSGRDGLDHYRTLFAQAAQLTSPPRYILTESLNFQHAALETTALSFGYTLSRTADLIQVFTKTV